MIKKDHGKPPRFLRTRYVCEFICMPHFIYVFLFQQLFFWLSMLVSFFYEGRKGRISVVFLFISIILAVVIGTIGHAIIGSSMAGGIIGSMITGFIGVWVGYFMLGSWGPLIADFAIVPAITGALLIVFMSGLLSRLMRRSAY
jgi:uncharacterized membrane protein YeaQ/YmgE (transglycosylase-associated protein family)